MRPPCYARDSLQVFPLGPTARLDDRQEFRENSDALCPSGSTCSNTDSMTSNEIPPGSLMPGRRLLMEQITEARKLLAESAEHPGAGAWPQRCTRLETMLTAITNTAEALIAPAQSTRQPQQQTGHDVAAELKARLAELQADTEAREC